LVFADTTDKTDYSVFGRQFFIKYNPSEIGPCQFDAAADQFCHLPQNGTMPRLSHGELRKRSVEFLTKNPYTKDGIHLKEYVPGNDWESYLESMAQDSTYGDNITLHAIAQTLGVRIIVLSTLGQSATTLILPFDRVGNASDPHLPLTFHFCCWVIILRAIVALVSTM
jgi:hypothetical protein